MKHFIKLVILLIILCMGALVAADIKIGDMKYPLYKRESVCPKIGQASSEGSSAQVMLTVRIPLDAEISNVSAYMANLPWGKGESDYKPTIFKRCVINGYKNESGEWGGGWAKAKLISIAQTDKSQVVTVLFTSWKHDNSRKAKLVVSYYFPAQGKRQ